MKFPLFSTLASFFRSFFKNKVRWIARGVTYSRASFIAHLDHRSLLNLTEEPESFLAPIAEKTPHIVTQLLGTVPLQKVEALLSSTEIHNRQEEQVFRKKYLDDIRTSRVVDGKLFKLLDVKTNHLHLLRRLDGDAKMLFKKTDKVQRLLGPYAVKLYHHRYIQDSYFSEMQYISGLRNVKDDLELIIDPQKKAERLLLLTRKMLTMLEYFQKNKLYWPDIKPSNFYIRPDTDELCVADYKNVFTRASHYLPRYAFTPDYTAPSIKANDRSRPKGSKNKVQLSEYQDQRYFSFLKTLEELLAVCDETQAAVQQVKEYISGVRKTFSLFEPKMLLYFQKKDIKKSSITLPESEQRSVFKKHKAKKSFYANLSFFAIGLFKDSGADVKVKDLSSLKNNGSVKRNFLSRIFRVF